MLWIVTAETKSMHLFLKLRFLQEAVNIEDFTLWVLFEEGSSMQVVIAVQNHSRGKLFIQFCRILLSAWWEET